MSSDVWHCSPTSANLMNNPTQLPNAALCPLRITTPLMQNSVRLHNTGKMSAALRHWNDHTFIYIDQNVLQ